MNTSQMIFAIVVSAVIIIAIFGLIYARSREAKRELELSQMAHGTKSLDLKSKRQVKPKSYGAHTAKLGARHKSHEGSTD